MGKRIATVFAAAMLLLPLPAVSFEAEGAIGYRSTTALSFPAASSISLSFDGFSAMFRGQGASQFDGIIAYDIAVGRTISNEFSFHSAYNPSEGGWSDLAYLFSQRFRWDFFALEYGLGISAGIAYSEYSSILSWSLSPLLALSGTFYIDPVSITLYFSMLEEWERDWKALPVFGLRLEWDIDGSSSIFADGYVKWAEYLMDPVAMISGYGIRLGYIYRGDI